MENECCYIILPKFYNLHRQVEAESGTCSRDAFRLDVSFVVFYYYLADGKANTGAAVGRLAVQTVKEGEDVIGMPGVKANAVVRNRDLAVPVPGVGHPPRKVLGRDHPAFNRDHGGNIGLAVLDGVGDQVGKQLLDLERDHVQRGKGLAEDHHILLLDTLGKLLPGVFKQLVQVGHLKDLCHVARP